QYSSGNRVTTPYKSTDWKNKIRCNNCLLFGHLARECRKTRGQPQSRGGANFQSSHQSKPLAAGDKSFRKCYNCGSSFHLSFQCPKRNDKGYGTRGNTKRVVRVPDNNTEKPDHDLQQF